MPTTSFGALIERARRRGGATIRLDRTARVSADDWVSMERRANAAEFLIRVQQERNGDRVVTLRPHGVAWPAGAARAAAVASAAPPDLTCFVDALVAAGWEAR